MKRYLILSFLVVFGCADSSQKLLETQPLDPAEAAAAAISEYDTDNDGAISVSEAKSSALDPRAGWDADGDKKISEQEIEARLERYEKVKPGMMMMSCNVVYRGQPLDGATVIFEPEAFLGGSIEPAEGTTDMRGVATMMIPDVAAQDPTFTGIRTGLYKVMITHPQAKISAKYNEKTTLTFEVSPVENVVPPTFNLR